MKKVEYFYPSDIPEQSKNLNKDKKYALMEQIQRRTIPQNNLIHLYFDIISEQYINLGHKKVTSDIVKELMKIKFWPKVTVNWIKILKSTSRYNKDTTREFIDSMISWAKITIDLELPDPEDRRLLEHYQDNYR